MNSKRFKGTIGDEYELFKIACPHHDDLQQQVQNIIQKHILKTKKNGLKALEIGCGIGYTTEKILESNNRIKVTSVDNEPLMVYKTKEFLDDYIQESRLSVIQKDSLNYLRNLSDKTLDIFASAFTLHNFEKNYRKDVMKEIFRVLTPKGLFVNADKYAQNSEIEHQKDLEWQINKFKIEYDKLNRPDLKEEWIKHYLEDNQPNIIMKEKESISYMKKLGYKKIKQVYREHMEAVIIATK